MQDWWSQLTALNQAFYAAAIFFGVFFLWQLISVLTGMGGDGDMDGDMDAPDDIDGATDDLHADALETNISFQLLSLRSILTFCTLFTWGSALYLNQGKATGPALLVSTLWGLAGMFMIAWLLYALRKLSETGTAKLVSAVGQQGTVYLDIPEQGNGEVRVLVGGRITFVKARAVDGAALSAGTPVTVVRKLDATTLEVSPT